MNKNYARALVSAAVVTLVLTVGAMAFAKPITDEAAFDGGSKAKPAKKLPREWVWKRQSVSFDDMYAR